MAPVNADNVEMVYGEGGPTRTGHRNNNNNNTGAVKPAYSSNHGNAPYVDFENVFDPFEKDADDLREFFDDVNNGPVDLDEEVENPNQIFHNPMNDGVLNDAVHQIAGSPWAKPAINPSNRPTEPLSIAKYASSLAFVLTIGWVGFLFFLAIWNYTTVGRIIIEIIMAILSFFGLFWNSYFTVSSIFKCFIPAKAFQSNTKYCSVVPEKKPKGAEWLNTTIQIPVYKESLQEVMMPTLKSCIKARDHYIRNTGARCNIVICDDGMMAFLKNNFAAAEMLWETIEATKGKYFKLSQLLQKVPKPSRRHLKGLSSHNVYEVFHRMLFYYHYNIGFVARSTWDRRGKFKKASNLNTHLRLFWGAEQLAGVEQIPIEEALIENSHNEDGSRYTMFGNDVSIGHLIIVNDADARMAQSVIMKTVPEFLIDKSLGFTQHATKTLDDQRGESYYINMLSAYTDSLYNGHFLLSSILGCHPPLVGHSIFLRSDAIRQTGRIRTLRKAQRWLKNIGLPFLSVDQIGSYNLQDDGSTEYWSENHVSEDFELMIHLYNLGFNGRYVNYPDCEFQEGITRTFDEEAGRHRKFSLGAHELMFNPFNSWVGQGIFSPLFKTFLRSDIPSYYKIFLTAYLFSYTSGGTYLLVYTMAAVARILDADNQVAFLSTFSSAGVLVLSVIVYYVIGYITFLFTMLKMKWANNQILFPEFRKRGYLYLVYRLVRYCMTFQLLFYTVMGSYFFLGSMDHLLARPGVVSATNKDSITIRRCTAFWDMAKFNIGSWGISIFILCLSYVVVLENEDWNYAKMPDDLLYVLIFAAPACLLAIAAFIVPIILNPFILGWPFNPPLCRKRSDSDEVSHLHVTKDGKVKTVDLHTFMNGADSKLDREIGRTHQKPDVELGSLGTNDFGGAMTAANPNDFRTSSRNRRGADPRQQGKGNLPTVQERKDYLSKQRSARNRNGNADKNFSLAMI